MQVGGITSGYHHDAVEGLEHSLSGPLIVLRFWTLESAGPLVSKKKEETMEMAYSATLSAISASSSNVMLLEDVTIMRMLRRGRWRNSSLRMFF